MKYAIGLDIGIASVGWATVELDKENTPFKIENLGSRIFNIAENPKDGSSLAKPRRDARGTRRRLRRHRHRLERIRNLIINENILTENEVKHLYDNPVSDIYELRTNALDRIVAKEELARILINLAQRRGFKSNRKADSTDKEAGLLLGAIEENKTCMEQKGYRTVGEMFFKDEAFSFCKRNKKENYKNTVSRAMVEDEVRRIFAAQKSFGNKFATDEMMEKYLDILLSQRSFEDGPGGESPYGGNQILKRIGLCTFEEENGEYRAAKAEYSCQYAVLLEKVNNLRIVCGNEKRALTDEERKIVITLAHNSASLTYAKLRKELHISDTEYFSSLSYGSRPVEEVEKKTKFEFLKQYHTLRKALDKISKGYISTVSTEKLDEIGLLLTTTKTETTIEEKLTEIGCNKIEIEALLTVPSFTGFGRLSRKACKNIIPFLEKGMVYSDACTAAGYDFRSHEGIYKERFLSATGKELDDITNPVVRRAVSQTIKVVNAIIREQDESPVYINVELARELSKDHDERDRISKEIEQNHSKNEKIVERLQKEFGIANPSGQDIVKLKLWEEQDGICPYSLKALELSRLFEPGYAEIDHIIPYSKCFDDGYKNKVLVKAAENRQKGNRLPLEYLNGKRNADFQVWVMNNVRDYRKRQNLLKEHFDEKDETEFKERNLQDTKYISRFVKNYIADHLLFAESSIAHNKKVKAVNGAATSYLRKRWGINKVREDGDLHHAVDAAVIACASEAMIQRISRYSKLKEIAYVKNEEAQSEEVVSKITGEIMNGFPPPWKDFRKELEIRLSSNPAELLRETKLINYTENDIEKVKPVFVSRMPKHKATGAAHKQTVKSPKAIDEGYVIVKKALTELKLKNGEIENYYKPESDTLLYNVLVERLSEFGGDGSKAFKDVVFHKPTSDGKPGPIVKKVKILEKTTLNVPVYQGSGVADNDSMVRIDVFYVEGEGYYWVPIYVADMIKENLPNKAVVAFKSYEEWKEMKDEDFIFSLYPDDLVMISSKKPQTLKIINKESTLPKEKIDNDFMAYYISAGISGGAITIINHDRTYTVASLGVKTLKKLEKYQVDPLGNYVKVGKETRQTFK